MAANAALAALLAAARECQLAAIDFSDEQAVQSVAVADMLHALFLPHPEDPLLQLPAELLSVILSRLGTRDLARLAGTCRLLWRDAPTPPPPSCGIGLLETELRQRAEARGLDVGSSLPRVAASWVACLLKRVHRDAQMNQAPLAVGSEHSMFVDKEGSLLTCGITNGASLVLGHDQDPYGDPGVFLAIRRPTPVPSMQDRRIVSVATADNHSLVLSAAGEVYSWGRGSCGQLGHGDEHARAVPSRIESLSRIERIVAGPNLASAAVDEKGRLFTWGRATVAVLRNRDGDDVDHFSTGLGYELDLETTHQSTPKWVEALSQNRVVCVAYGESFTLAVTDAGAVFSFGCGALGHGSSHVPPENSVLPRRIEALVQTGRRFVAVAAGRHHALALTEEGQLYGWGAGGANGHGRREFTPLQVAAFIGVHVKLVNARDGSSCAVTEKGELFTWGDSRNEGRLGHGDELPHSEPKRVDGLSGVKVAAVAIGVTHTLAADVDGVVWAFGRRSALGLGAASPEASPHVWTPTPIPTLRVRALINSP